MKNRKFIKDFYRQPKRKTDAHKWAQLFRVFERCSLDAKITKFFDHDEAAYRRGMSLVLKTGNYFDFNFLSENYLNLCNFLEIYLKHQQLSLPDFIVVNPPQGKISFFIVRSTRKTKFSEEN
ncbi:hypothetical protein [Anabaena sp. CCY 9910]|uniref:hypothetical protein n=1 Tax=Anabaena sp. CCY 9910 TaxID=3103870 RepID=UPI0039E0D989